MIFGNELVKTLRNLIDSAEKKLWIIVPFIGNWDSVQRIIGTKWISNTNIDVKLLTDVNNETLIKKDTLSKFQYRAKIRTLPGLHAKIYVVDDKILYSSANLTGTAFSKRYEFGILQDYDKNFENIFYGWWNDAQEVESSWLPTKKSSLDKTEKDNVYSIGLKKIWNLPLAPMKVTKFKYYRDYLKLYAHFKNIYSENVKRVWNTIPIYHEIDSFFNYLFHEHKNKPSKPFHRNKDYRRISDQRRISDLKKHMKEYSEWIKYNDFDNETGRIEKIQKIKNKLSKENIDKINHDDIEIVVNSIHSMTSLPLNKIVFLKQENNSVTEIIRSWKNLLHETNKSIEVRMEECNKELYRWGKSAICELISYYYPDRYPVINSNSISGMKYFGYNVKN